MGEQGCRDLRVEHLIEPIAVAATAPRFSWIADHAQTGYRIVVTDAAGAAVWDSERVDGPETSLIAYAGAPLRPDADYTWSVESRTGDGIRRGSSRFSTAPDLAAWDAPWIEPAQQPAHVERWSLFDWIRGAGPETSVAERLRPVQLLRQRVVLDAAPVRARLHMTARGVYSAWLGGARVGDEVLAPGFDSYRSRISVQTYDVADQLAPGENVLAVALADGWWAGRIGLTGSSAQFGDRTSATWRLEMAFADGSSRVIRSGADVRSAPGPWTHADLFVGERFDARAVPAGWRSPGFDDSPWTPVADRGVDAAALVPFRGEPVRRVRELPAASVRETPEGWIVDFGQVIAGRVRLTLRGLPAGREVVVEHTETLDGAGAWFSNIVGINKEQTDVHVATGEPETVWEPEFAFHGFRYARVRGIASLSPEDAVAVVVLSDLDYGGGFSTSDARLNRLHENVVWSQRANFLAVPTDCPQRERAGWTGDIQVFAPAAANNAGIASFLARWLDNLRADQLDDGRIPITSPRSPFDAEAAASAQGIGAIVAAAGWSDAIAIVPWALYESYGDVRVLEENFDAVLAWIGFQTGAAASELRDEYADAPPERRARQALLYNTGDHFGDWLTPSTLEGRPTHEAIGIAPALTSELVAPMFQAHTLVLAARMAEVLSRPEAGALREHADRVRAAFVAEYLADDGSLPVELQGMHALVLGLDLAPASLRQAVGDRLAALVRAHGNRLDTGFLSTPYLLDALWDTGHRDLARKVLWQRESPSWLYEVDHDATTVWEAWDAVAPDGVVRPVSMNHYAFGCVDDWLYRRVAGLQPAAPGWRRARIEPDFDAGVGSVAAHVQTPMGRLGVEWHREGDTATVRVDVPFGIDAVLVVDGASTPLPAGAGVHRVDLAVPARS
jgi:alpha-L-rhamnosidase